MVYADAAAKHALSVLDRYDYNEDIPEWNDDGTMNNEERVLITQSMKEVNKSWKPMWVSCAVIRA